MNHFNELKTLIEEVRGTASQSMKAVMAVSAKIKAKKERAKLIAGLKDSQKGKK